LLPELGLSKRVHVEKEMGWTVTDVVRANAVADADGVEEPGEVEKLLLETRTGQKKDVTFMTVR
jgi:hypothetical protein